MASSPKEPGKINPDAGEPEKGIPDAGDGDDATLPPQQDPHDGDEPFPPDPASLPPAEA